MAEPALGASCSQAHQLCLTTGRRRGNRLRAQCLQSGKDLRQDSLCRDADYGPWRKCPGVGTGKTCSRPPSVLGDALRNL